MHITLVDDSIPFDGYSPLNRPLGGAEKAFAGLAGALARRGHDVHVFNRAAAPAFIDGAQWETLEAPPPAQTDVLIAFRKTALLPFVRLAGRRLLWTTATARQLAPAAKALESYRPALVLLGQRQATGVTLPAGVTAQIVTPGVGAEFLADVPVELAAQPTAVVTTHPSHGLDGVLDLWRAAVRPRVPTARLVVVSAALARGIEGGDVAESLAPILDKARAMAEDGVVVVRPMPDDGMARLYRSARAHLYPGHDDDMACWTLMDSQAVGLPAVVRDKGAAAERIVAGQSGQVAPDDAAFANLAVTLLENDDVFWSMNRDARLLHRDQSWDVAAAHFETLFGAA